MVRLGIHVPAAFAGPLPPARAYLDFFQHAEALGFHSLWSEDRIFHAANFLDAMTLLSWAAAATTRVQLGTAVLVLALRNAPLLARQVSTLDYLSGGRLALGISVGGHPSEYQGLGIPMQQRVARLRENITVLRQLLSGEPVSTQGRFYDLHKAIIRPASPQPNGVPLYMGGRVDTVLQRAGELSDGWIMGPFGTTDECRTSVAKVQSAAHAAGRDPQALVIGKLIYAQVDDDVDRAYRTLHTFLHGYYSRPVDVTEVAAFGKPQEVIARLQAFAEAGVSTFMLGVPTLEVSQLERLAHEVMPHLQAQET